MRVWDVDFARQISSACLHPGSGTLSLALGGGDVFSQGREGRLLWWRLLPSGALSASPLASLQTGCYNFCRAAVARSLAMQQPTARGAAPAPCAAAGEAPCYYVAVAGEEAGVLDLFDLRSATLVQRLAAAATTAAGGGGSEGAAPRGAGMVMAVRFLPAAACAGGGSLPGVVVGYEDGAARLWEPRQPGARAYPARAALRHCAFRANAVQGAALHG